MKLRLATCLKLPICYVRTFRLEDAHNLSLAGNDESIRKVMSHVFDWPYSAQAAMGQIQFALKQWPERTFAIEVGGKCAGLIQAVQQPGVYARTYELGGWLGIPYRGRGIYCAARSELIRWLFETTDANRIESVVFSNNMRPQETIEKTGMKLEGRERARVWKDGVLLDRLIYGILREEFFQLADKEEEAPHDGVA